MTNEEKYPGELHTIPRNFIIRNCMEPSRRLFFISLGAADFVTYHQREVFFPTLFCQANGINNKFIQYYHFVQVLPQAAQARCINYREFRDCFAYYERFEEFV